MSTLFGSNPSFDQYHWSGAGNWNQESTNKGYSITGPGRVVDLNVFWDGDGGTTAGQNGMWKASDNSLELNSSSYTSGVGSHSSGGQHLHTTSHDYFYVSTHSVDVGFFRTRDDADGSVASVDSAGTDGQTKTIASIGSMSGASSFLTVYGGLGKGALRAYGHYNLANVYVRRGAAWTRISVSVHRGAANTKVVVAVRRGSGWTEINMVPSHEWGDELEKQVKIIYPNGDWEYGIIREEETICFGNYDPRDEPQSKRIYVVKNEIVIPELVAA